MRRNGCQALSATVVGSVGDAVKRGSLSTERSVVVTHARLTDLWHGLDSYGCVFLMIFVGSRCIVSVNVRGLE